MTGGRVIKIPHAHTVNVITDPPLQILHVGTTLPENPQSPGFDAEAKYELLRAAMAEMVAAGCDGHKVHWDVSAPGTSRG
jgi:hypothetical protein